MKMSKIIKRICFSAFTLVIVLFNVQNNQVKIIYTCHVHVELAPLCVTLYLYKLKLSRNVAYFFIFFYRNAVLLSMDI